MGKMKIFIDEYSITIGFLLNAGNVTRYSLGGVNAVF